MSHKMFHSVTLNFVFYRGGSTISGNLRGFICIKVLGGGGGVTLLILSHFS